MIAWQDPPPYVQFMEEAREMGELSYAYGVCGALQVIEIDPARAQRAAEAAGDDLARRAIAAGALTELMLAAQNDGSDQAKADFRFMLAEPPANETEAQAILRENAIEDFLVDRCSRALRLFREFE